MRGPTSRVNERAREAAPQLSMYGPKERFKCLRFLSYCRLEKLRMGWQFVCGSLAGAAAWVERQAGCSPALGLGRKAVAAPRTREGAAHVGCPSRLA